MNKHLRNIFPTTGVHFLAELQNCSESKLRRLTAAKMRKAITSLVKRSGFSELGHFYYEFKGGGLTGIVALSESHVAFHTWPELGYVTLDVYLCNYRNDNRRAADALFRKLSKLFMAKDVRIRKVVR